MSNNWWYLKITPGSSWKTAVLGDATRVRHMQGKCLNSFNRSLVQERASSKLSLSLAEKSTVSNRMCPTFMNLIQPNHLRNAQLLNSITLGGVSSTYELQRRTPDSVHSSPQGIKDHPLWC